MSFLEKGAVAAAPADYNTPHAVSTARKGSPAPAGSSPHPRYRGRGPTSRRENPPWCDL